MGDEPPLIGRQRGGTLDGLDALVADGTGAHVLGAEEARQGRAAGKVGGLARRPVGEKVAAQQGVFVLNPGQDVWEGVGQGTREAMGEAPGGADHPAAMGDEWRQGTPGWALGGQGRQCVTMREQECTVEVGVRGGVLGMTGRAGGTGLGQGPRVEGKEHEAVVLT